MYNPRVQREAEKAILDCRKTLFECALQREQLKMSKQIAMSYMEDRIISEDVNLTTAIRMQEALDDRYYTEEGGIFSTIWETIKEMFRKLKAWLLGEKAPSTKPADYPVKQVKSDKPVDVNGIDGVMTDIEKLTKELGNVDDLEKAEETANSIKDKLAEAMKPTPGKVAGLVSVSLLIGIFTAGVTALKNAEKTAADLEAKMKDTSITDEEKDKIQKKLNILNKITGSLASVQKFVTDLLHKATGAEDPKDDNAEDPKDGNTEDPKDDNAEDPKDGNTEDPKDDNAEDPKDGNTEDPKDDNAEDPKDGNTEDPKDDNAEDPKDGNTEDPKDDNAEDPKPKSKMDIGDYADMVAHQQNERNAKNDASLNPQRRQWFIWKFRYACTERGLGKISKNIKPEIFPPNLRDEMKDKKELTVKDLNKIGATLGVNLRLIPDNYDEIQKEVRDRANKLIERDSKKKKSSDQKDWYDLIPYSWWTLENPYRLKPDVLRKLKKTYTKKEEYEDVLNTYGQLIGYIGDKAHPYPTEPPVDPQLTKLGWYN